MHQVQKPIVGLGSLHFSLSDISIFVKQIIQLHKYFTVVAFKLCSRKGKICPRDINQVVGMVVEGVPWDKEVWASKDPVNCHQRHSVIICSLDQNFRHKTSEAAPIFYKITPILFYLLYNYLILDRKFNIGVASLQIILWSSTIH